MPSTQQNKFLWNLLDRVMFIGIGAIGAVATTYFTGIMKLNPPELKAHAIISEVDATHAVASSVGGLKLNYQNDAKKSYKVLSIDIANEGRGPAQGVKFQVKLDPSLVAEYYTEPDFKVYSPAMIQFDKNEFFAELKDFPAGASDRLALRFEGDPKSACNSRIKLVSSDYEGEVKRDCGK